jgi:hypothetical protein
MECGLFQLIFLAACERLTLPRACCRKQRILQNSQDSEGHKPVVSCKRKETSSARTTVAAAAKRRMTSSCLFTAAPRSIGRPDKVLDQSVAMAFGSMAQARPQFTPQHGPIDLNETLISNLSTTRFYKAAVLCSMIMCMRAGEAGRSPFRTIQGAPYKLAISCARCN